ncbi:MAG: hypothetical protein M3Y36_09510 [Actinomycetota bacterium]|nr:hypothetical protein [Actinomycetota bacterium]
MPVTAKMLVIARVASQSFRVCFGKGVRSHRDEQQGRDHQQDPVEGGDVARGRHEQGPPCRLGGGEAGDRWAQVARTVDQGDGAQDRRRKFQGDDEDRCRGGDEDEIRADRRREHGL